MFFKKKTRNQQWKTSTETKVKSIKLENPFSYYTKRNSLAEGSSWLVFKAVKNLTGQMAAVKVIDVKEITPKKEVEFMQNTKHRNITKLLEIYLWKDVLYICMEHCNGGSLWDLCYETGPLTELEIAYVTKECLQALYYMHGRGYMHRDIKLENIFLTSTGVVKIGVFGEIDRMENLPDEVAGTEETRAPEVSKVGERGSYDEKCDIWSLGISLLDLADCMSLVTYKPDEVYQSWATNTKNQWSEDFKSFVRAALTVDPARRPTAEELYPSYPTLIKQRDMTRSS
uniref:Protein kinase domain-containing protein n=1 Tax=Denticeps clupeoides TaxID=299321 RepID=A0AAY4BRV2_9TELE